jgi:hypothetical protein
MKVTLDIDCFDNEEFKNLLECIEERRRILSMINIFKAGNMRELEMSMCWGKKTYLYLHEDEILANKEWVKRTLELLLETNERDTKDLIERLGVVSYEE